MNTLGLTSLVFCLLLQAASSFQPLKGSSGFWTALCWRLFFSSMLEASLPVFTSRNPQYLYQIASFKNPMRIRA